MTGPATIAAALGVIALLMILASQHGISTRTTTTANEEPSDGEHP